MESIHTMDFPSCVTRMECLCKYRCSLLSLLLLLNYTSVEIIHLNILYIVYYLQTNVSNVV